MHRRRFGRLGWNVSEVGYGMWGIGGWTGSDDATGMEALQHAVDLGCDFFDTAWIYGRGHSENLLGRLLRANPDRRLRVATKIPPKDRAWPSSRQSRLEDVFPSDHIVEYTHKSLQELQIDHIDLLQFHVWEDSWAGDARWQDTVSRLRADGLVGGIGISINRWEPTNVLEALGTGMIDAVQVIYNIFDQAPEDQLLPACAAADVAVIARVPFDEGTLTGTLTAESTWPADDWRTSYFVPENLIPAVARADALRDVIPDGMSMPELALRFILTNPMITTVIPGMRSVEHVQANMGVSDGTSLSDHMMRALRAHRWDRQPTWWSQ